MAALWILGILLALIVAALFLRVGVRIAFGQELRVTAAAGPDRKSTRLNSSHVR